MNWSTVVGPLSRVVCLQLALCGVACSLKRTATEPARHAPDPLMAGLRVSIGKPRVTASDSTCTQFQSAVEAQVVGNLSNALSKSGFVVVGPHERPDMSVQWSGQPEACSAGGVYAGVATLQVAPGLAVTVDDSCRGPECEDILVSRLVKEPRMQEIARRLSVPPASSATSLPAVPESYKFSWKPPNQGEQRPPGSAKLTVAVVAPSWAEHSVALQQTYRTFAAGFADSLDADFDKILLAKGITFTGPYKTYEDITYGDKKAADLSLTPRVSVTAKFDVDKSAASASGDHVRQPFKMTAQGFIEFVLVETISRQKLWAKTLDLEVVTVTGADFYKTKTVELSAPDCNRKVDSTEKVALLDGRFCAVTRTAPGELAYDGKEKALAEAMERWYPTIVQKAWTYLDPTEMTALKPQVAEIRARSTAIVR